MTLETKTFIVSPQQTAKQMRSGDLDVLATPALVAMVEQVARDFLREKCTAQQTSVGTMMQLNHLYPSKIGATISIGLQVKSQKHTKWAFIFEAFQGSRKIAEGEHRRVIVETAPFLQKLAD